MVPGEPLPEWLQKVPKPLFLQQAKPAPDPLTRAKRLLEQGDSAETVKLLREAVRRDPDNSEAHDLLAALLIPLNEFDQSIHHTMELMRLQGRSPISCWNLAICYGNKYRLKEAVEWANEALALLRERQAGNAEEQARDFWRQLAAKFLADIKTGRYKGGEWSFAP